MKKMFRFALLPFLAMAALAQNAAPPAEKPPAGLEDAVRKRANELFTLLLNQQYRKAENWIAEDTKDYYYAGPKMELHKFEVLTVEFPADFTHAVVMVKCAEPVTVAGFPPGDLTLNIKTLWKLENGDWSYYVDPEKMHNPTGLGHKIQSAVDQAKTGNLPSQEQMLKGAPATDQAKAGNLPSPEQALKALPKDSGFVMNKLTLEKSQITITAGGTESVAVLNGAQGPATLQLGYPLEGIEATLDQNTVMAGQKVTLTLKAGKAPKGGTFYLQVVPTNETLKLQIDVK